jgi:hypothetical protein
MCDIINKKNTKRILKQITNVCISIWNKHIKAYPSDYYDLLHSNTKFKGSIIFSLNNNYNNMKQLFDIIGSVKKYCPIDRSLTMYSERINPFDQVENYWKYMFPCHLKEYDIVYVVNDVMIDYYGKYKNIIMHISKISKNNTNKVHEKEAKIIISSLSNEQLNSYIYDDYNPVIQNCLKGHNIPTSLINLIISYYLINVSERERLLNY